MKTINKKFTINKPIIFTIFDIILQNKINLTCLYYT